ncbi:hypothetical protein BC941DRAFT_473725 [Chlamydoabsidia padenii]|nr:hypothetical protein BC941DRAFT_473725 [Chlamydoabsidia padenii]
MKSILTTTTAALVMMVCLMTPSAQAQGAEACIDACFTPHGIKGRCPEDIDGYSVLKIFA